MWSWLSSLDVNAVLAAILAVVAYLHNHSFRVAVHEQLHGKLPEAPKGPGAGAATTAIVLALAALFAFNACHTTTSQRVAVATTCTASTLASVRAKVQPDENRTVLAIELAAEEAACVVAGLEALDSANKARLAGSGAVEAMPGSAASLRAGSGQ